MWVLPPNARRRTSHPALYGVLISPEASIESVSELTQETAQPELRDVHETDRFGPYIRESFERWPYIWYVSASELRARQVTTVLGNLWHLLNPALTVAVYYVIFGLLLKVNRGVDNFILFLTIGLFTFAASQRAITAGAVLSSPTSDSSRPSSSLG